MYITYTKGLGFDENPDYMYLRQLFRILFRTLNHQYDYTFDWTMLKQKAAFMANMGPSASAQGQNGQSNQGQGVQGHAASQPAAPSGTAKHKLNNNSHLSGQTTNDQFCLTKKQKTSSR